MKPPATVQRPLLLPNIRAPKNGYAYVYVSNGSDQSVYFDNLRVVQEHGRIIEEDHYYAYGLKITGISSKKLPDASEVANIKNGYLYNGKELFDDADLNWYDYGFRNYDPQIGRFVQLDPLTWEYPELTNYQYASCEPVANVDRDGLEAEEVLQTTGVDVIVRPGARLLGPLATKVFQTVVTQLPYFVYTNVNDKSQFKTHTDLGATHTDEDGKFYQSSQGIDTYTTRTDVTAEYNQAQKEASALDDFHNSFVFRAAGKIGPLTDVYRNGRGDVKYVSHPEALGNTEYGSVAVFNILTLGTGSAAQEEGNVLYHYTSKEAAQSIEQQGLRVGRDGFSYLTDEGNLSGLQSQIDLALPANRALPNAVLKIDVSGMNPAIIRRVTGNLPGYGAGGGTEFLFDQFIPASRISIVR